MTATAHARYGTRLAALGDDEAILAAAGEQCLARDYARFHPTRQPFATVVFRNVREPVLRVEAYDARPSGEGVVASDAGWLRVSAFPSDPALPSLPALLARHGEHTVVRYRPFRRCTVRFDGSYAKVFADRRGRRMLGEGAMLWAAAERGGLDFAVPRPERYEAASRTLWQSEVPGHPVRGEVAHPIGAALASLAKAHLTPHRVLGPDRVLARSVRLGRALVRSVPRVERDVDDLLARLRSAHSAASLGPLAPVHGNPHLGQWVGDGSALGLVDFDGLALGQPELDAAAVVTALECEDPERAPIEQVRAAFLAGYRERGGALDDRRMAIYGAHRRLAKAVRVASSLRPDGDRRAARHLRRALRDLEEEGFA